MSTFLDAVKQIASCYFLPGAKSRRRLIRIQRTYERVSNEMGEGRLEYAGSLCDSAIPKAMEERDWTTYVNLIVLRAHVHLAADEFDAAQELFEKCLEICRPQGVV